MFIDNEIKSRADARLFELSAMTLQQLQDLNRGVNRLAIRQREAKQKQDERDRAAMLQQSMQQAAAASSFGEDTMGVFAGRGAGLSDAEQTLALARTASGVTGSVLAAVRFANQQKQGTTTSTTSSSTGHGKQIEESANDTLTQADLQRGQSLEERYIVWRDVLHDALNRKLR